MTAEEVASGRLGISNSFENGLLKQCLLWLAGKQLLIEVNKVSTSVTTPVHRAFIKMTSH